MRSFVRRAGTALALALVAGVGLTGTPATATAGTTPAATPDRAAEQFMLKFAHSGMCLTVPAGAIRTAGAWLEQRPCDGYASSQRWTYQVAGSGIERRIRSPWSGMCVNVRGAVYGYDTQIVQYPCGPEANNFFKREKILVPGGRLMPPGDYFYVVPGATSRWALDLRGGSTAAGAKVVLWEKRLALDAANQWLREEPLP